VLKRWRPRWRKSTLPTGLTGNVALIVQATVSRWSNGAIVAEYIFR